MGDILSNVNFLYRNCSPSKKQRYREEDKQSTASSRGMRSKRMPWRSRRDCFVFNEPRLAMTGFHNE